MEEKPADILSQLCTSTSAPWMLAAVLSVKGKVFWRTLSPNRMSSSGRHLEG